MCTARNSLRFRVFFSFFPFFSFATNIYVFSVFFNVPKYVCAWFFFRLASSYRSRCEWLFFSSYSLCKTIYKIYNRYAMCAFKISSLALVGFGFLSLESSKIIGNAHVVVTNFVGSAIISDGSFFSSVAQTTLPSK